MTKEPSLISEISSIPRLEILRLLNDSPLKTSQIAKKTSSSIQGSKRHLERLTTSRLIQKHPDGNFTITSLGYAMLLQVDFFDFFRRHEAFFSNHSLDGIPESLIRRMGELINCEYEPNTMRGLQRSRDMIANNKEWACGMAAIIPLEFFDEMIPVLKKGVKHRIVFGKNTIVPHGFDTHPSRVNEWLLAKKKKQVEEKFVESIPINMVVTESEAMAVFFDNDGHLDAKSMFFGKDQLFRKWCMDLVDYFWNFVPEIPEFKLREV